MGRGSEKVRTLPFALILLTFGWVAPWEANLALVAMMIYGAIQDCASWRG